MARNAYGEEREPTQADLDRWRQEEAREFGFSGNDEETPAERRARRQQRDKPVTIHRFSTCEIVGCPICAEY